MSRERTSVDGLTIKISLSGKHRFRTSWLGKQILQVELTRTYYQGKRAISGQLEHGWRDAKEEDLGKLHVTKQL